MSAFGFGSPKTPTSTGRTKSPNAGPVTGYAVPRNPPETDLLGSTPAPPAIDMPSLETAGGLAATLQRKRAAKYAMLIEGQPADAKTTGPAPVLKRRELLGY